MAAGDRTDLPGAQLAQSIINTQVRKLRDQREADQACTIRQCVLAIGFTTQKTGGLFLLS